MGAAAIVGRVAGVFECGLFFLVDAPDIADYMAGQLFVWVVTEQPCFDFHPGKLPRTGGQFGDFFIRELDFEREGVEILAFITQLAEAF